jgi:hypothetical protein
VAHSSTRIAGPVAALAALSLALLLSAPAGAADGKYHTYQELSAALKAAAAAHPDLARVVSIGKTREGRELWAVELGNAKGVPLAERPALLVAASFEADHLVGSEIALSIVQVLLDGYAADPSVKERLDNHVVYVIPRMNPDGAEGMFAPVKAWRRTNATPVDADNDGRLDENGPEDLNKDGVITMMRVKDPKGPYMVSPDDPRLMKRADPAKGETGGWSIYWEGRDTDGDGFIAEDGPGGVDLNRNFLHQYPYFEPDAGHHMASEVETRALLDFLLKHRNIAAILTFGESDNLVTPPNRRGELATPGPLSLLDFANRSIADARQVGIFQDPAAFGGRGGRGFMGGDEGGFPGAGRGTPAPTGRAAMPARRPATTVTTADVEYFRAISDKYRELTGIRSVGYTRAPAGAFFEYGYYQFGVPSFSTPGWGLPGTGRPAATGAAAPGASGPPPAMAGRGGRGGAAAPGDAGDAPPEGIDARLLQWMDAEKVDGFAPWTPFTHPTLGQVEIGGFKPYVAVNPPAARLTELGASHAKFVVYLTSLFPRITIAKAEATPLGGGLYRVRADVENAGYLPTALAQAVTARAVAPTLVQLVVPPESVISGHEKTNYLPSLAGSASRQSYEWLIRGKAGTTVTLKVVSQKAGSDTAAISLK